MKTIEYFLNDLDIKVFDKSSQVKAKSFIDTFTPHNLSDVATYLVLGKNIVGHGLKLLGYDVTEADGLTSTLTLDNIISNGETYDYIIAPDEHFVQFGSEDIQVKEIYKLCNIATKGVYTTLKDYRNMHASQRFFQEPFEVKQDDGDSIIIRKREWNKTDKQRWTQREYIIKNDHLIVCDPIDCRTMYFKQLAKFSSDAGAKTFQVEKKQMYKPLFSKTFEYIVYSSF